MGAMIDIRGWGFGRLLWFQMCYIASSRVCVAQSVDCLVSQLASRMLLGCSVVLYVTKDTDLVLLLDQWVLIMRRLLHPALSEDLVLVVYM